MKISQQRAKYSFLQIVGVFKPTMAPELTHKMKCDHEDVSKCQTWKRLTV